MHWRSRRSRSPLSRSCFSPEMNRFAVFPAPSCRVVRMPVTFADDFNDNARGKLARPFVGSLAEACAWSASRSTGGLLPAHVLAECSDDPEGFRQALVSVGLGQRRPKGAVQIAPGKSVTIENADGTDGLHGERPLASGSALASASPARKPQTPAARRVALCRSPELARAIRERDAGQCRYCGKGVRQGAGRAPDSAVWDWVDPLGPMSAENVVIACKACSEMKAGHLPEEAGVTLLPPPEAKKRYAARNASDLRSNASLQTRNAYTSVTAGQKHYTPAKTDDDLDRSKSSSSRVKGSPPKLTAREAKAEPGTLDFQLRVMAEFSAEHHAEITVDEADALAAEVLGCSKEPVSSKLGYVLRAVRSETRPFARWLSSRPVPAARSGRLPHCGDGECNKDTRRREDPETGADAGPCPKCSGSAVLWEAM